MSPWGFLYGKMNNLIKMKLPIGFGQGHSVYSEKFEMNGNDNSILIEEKM